MQITLPPTIATTDSALPGEIGADIFLEGYNEGESFEARVIFFSENMAHLKTAEGNFIRARLEGGLIYGLNLNEGMEISLTVVEKSSGLIKLRLNEDKKLIPLTTTLDSASSSGTVTSATIGQILQKLCALLSATNSIPAQLASAQPRETPPSALTPLFELFMPEHIEQNSRSVPVFAPEQPDRLSAQITLEQALPESANSLAPKQTVTATIAKVAATRTNTPPLPQALTTETTQAVSTTELSQDAFPKIAIGTEQNDWLPQTVSQEPVTLSALTPAIRREVLAFTHTLVTELYPPGINEPSRIEMIAFVEQLFTQIDKPMKELGPALARTARELEVRLELLQQTIKNSSLPIKETLLQQFDHLLQQTSDLHEERPICLQFPLYFAEQRQTAELYVYRREKNAKRIDPSHATVLLALNTEHLGRLEALIQVRQKDLDIKLEVSRAEAITFLNEQRAILKNLLANAGYRLNSATIQPLLIQTSSKTAESILEEFRKSFMHQVDIRI